jgi:tRNA uridine 5-carboxymethylaminomethyl modification enzyme
MNNYDVIIIGAGHAGIEAALAATRLGAKALILTLDLQTIGLMSCNPAIGGVGKGQLVKEIDALGGEMAKAADACGIQFRILNASKGAAVQSSRAQIDLDLYNRYMKKVITSTPGLEVREGEVKRLIVEDKKVCGIVTDKGENIGAGAVVITPGTFLDGLIHIGLKHFSGGRINERASEGLAGNLGDLGFELLRFKTGTPARIDRNTIDYSKLIVQEGDNPPKPFSFKTHTLTQKQIHCHITYTNRRTHKIITDNLNRSPLYTGLIKATGVRYCPSVEDKIVKFKDKERHQIFLEPQGLNTDLVYPNGISTSLPEDVQLEFIHSIEGLEEAKIMRFGYGIEHVVVEPTQLYPTLETKNIRNLYLAGQINGTTGYEEAAAQGLVAGINAIRRVKGEDSFVLDRSTSYIGVLIDDLTTKGTNEPYRMFTSRVEYRLIIREDNADLRLGRMGYELGLLSKEDFGQIQERAEAIEKGMSLLKKTRIHSFKGQSLKKSTTLEELLRRPEVTLNDFPEIDIAKAVEVEVKYSGFIQRQLRDVERFKNLEKIKIPLSLDYKIIPSLSREIKEKLDKFRPMNLGQASRISGITPAAITMLMIYLRKIDGQK